MIETETGNIQDMFKTAIDSIVNGGTNEVPPSNTTQAEDDNRRQQEEIERRNQILQQQRAQQIAQQQRSQQNFQNTLNMFENPMLNIDEISKQLDNMIDTKNIPGESKIMYYIMGGGILLSIFFMMNKSYTKREEYY